MYLALYLQEIISMSKTNVSNLPLQSLKNWRTNSLLYYHQVDKNELVLIRNNVEGKFACLKK